MEHTVLLHDQKSNPRQCKYKVFLFNFGSSQAKQLNPYYESLDTFRKTQSCLWQILNLPSKKYALKVKKRQLLLKIFK